MNAPDVASQFALDSKALSALREEAKKSPDKALGAAASQFEAVFLQMMLKSMRDATPQDGPLDSNATKMYTTMFDQQIALTMAKRGTGLAPVIERQLARALPHPPGQGSAIAHPAGGTTPAATGSSVRPPAAAAMTAPARRAVAPATVTPGASSVHSVGAALESYRRTANPARTYMAPPAAATAKSAAAPSAATTTTAASGSGFGDRVRSFVASLRPAAEAAAKAIGVPVQYLLAQAGLESGWGAHQPKDASNGASHNVFGIKAGTAWQGRTVAAATHEVVAGATVPTQARFRAYDSYASSFRDFAKLMGSRRYASARANAADPVAYATALQRGGYATDPAYAAKLAGAIRSVTPYVEVAATPATQVRAAAADNRDVRT